MFAEWLDDALPGAIRDRLAELGVDVEKFCAWLGGLMAQYRFGEAFRADVETAKNARNAVESLLGHIAHVRKAIERVPPVGQRVWLQMQLDLIHLTEQHRAALVADLDQALDRTIPDPADRAAVVEVASWAVCETDPFRAAAGHLQAIEIMLRRASVSGKDGRPTKHARNEVARRVRERLQRDLAGKDVKIDDEAHRVLAALGLAGEDADVEHMARKASRPRQKLS
jgi:hypothetical protein